MEQNGSIALVVASTPALALAEYDSYSVYMCPCTKGYTKPLFWHYS
jgi:hypothetical protein